MAFQMPELTKEAKERVEKVLHRAATDIQFREALLSRPDEALKGVDLHDEERSLLREMKRVRLEEWGIDVRRFRSMLRDNGVQVTLLEYAVASKMFEKKKK